MSAESEPVHMEGEMDKNMAETSEESELQQNVLTLESILFVCGIFYLFFIAPNVIESGLYPSHVSVIL